MKTIKQLVEDHIAQIEARSDRITYAIIQLQSGGSVTAEVAQLIKDYEALRLRQGQHIAELLRELEKLS